jgi:hypothetical protein
MNSLLLVFVSCPNITNITIANNMRLSDYDGYPNCFKRALPYLLASLLFHHDFLRQNLDATHPLWNQRLFTIRINLNGSTYSNAYVAMKDSLLTGHNYCPETSMQATGIPSHLAMAAEIRDLRY